MQASSEAAVPDPSVFAGGGHPCRHHTAAGIDAAGRLLGNDQFASTAAGYAQLAVWLAAHGEAQRVGVAGTGHPGGCGN